MPTVGKKTFAYTKAGLAKAKAEAKRTGKKLVGGLAGGLKSMGAKGAYKAGSLLGKTVAKAGLARRKTLLSGLGKGIGSPSKKVPTMTTDFHKRKAAAKKDKGKPNTPGEMMRTFKGMYTAGQARNKKMFRGDFDKGKKIRYQRRGK